MDSARPPHRRVPGIAFATLVLTLLVALLTGAAGAQVSPPTRPVVTAALADDHSLAASLAAEPATLMLQLRRLPAALAALRAEATGDSPGQVLAAGRTQRAAIASDQRQTLNQLAALPAVEVLYSVQNAYNGIAVRAAPEQLARLAALPGVMAVRPLVLHERENSGSVALIGAPEVWGGATGLTGEGVTIGIIDTGIDYLHTNFGGPGSYTGSDSTLLTDAPSLAHFGPGKKVAGGYDFVGDAYTGSNGAAPDPDPLDCASASGGGHGSHVAGSAAGYGVNADGSTYSGPYSSGMNLAGMRIGPGVAPQATLYALRVFGCTGSTAFTAAAIDWALDPNDDGDFADHLDVLNLSLGSAYGTANDPSAAALNNAAAVGVIAVASAGNSGDVYYIGGSPGSAPRAISVANSVDSSDTVDAFQVNNTAIAGIKVASFATTYNWAASSPITASLVYPATNTTGCAAFTGADATLVSGRIVLVDWAPQGSSNFPCGSGVRATNAAAAGAVGIVMASGQNFFDAVIGGSAAIPAVFTTYTVGQELKSVLTQGSDSGLSLTLSNTFRNTGRFVLPAIADMINSSSSRGPQGISSRLKPDISAPGTGIFSTDSGSGSGGKNLSGTSMAAPHVAGVMALLRQQRPTWTVEELKALVMNTAGHDLFAGQSQTPPKYGPARAGAGRVDVPQAIAGQVIAYDSARPEEVSVSFGAVQVLGSATLTRTVAVRNFGAIARSYTVAYDGRTDIPGVSYGFPDGTTLNVPAGASASFRVVLSATASEMRHVRDSTVDEQQGGFARQWLSEESGLITLTPANGNTLRLPIYATARPASDLRSVDPALAFGGPTAATTITLTGQALANSTGAATPAEQVALVSPLELQHTSPPTTTAGVANADLHYVGVHSDAATRAATGQSLANSMLWFGVATYGDWTTPATELQFTVFIDRDRNGSDDVSLFTTRLVLANGNNIDVFVSGVGNTQASLLNGADAATLDTALFNNNVLLIPVSASQLGINMSGASARFNYRVEVSRRFVGVVDRTPTLTYDARNPGLDFSGGTVNSGSWMVNSGSTLPVTFNQAAYQANASQGALLLHHFNRSGERAELLPVGLRQTLSFNVPAGKQYGDAPFAVSATSSAGLPATLSSETPAVCILSGGTLTILAAGDCTLRARQAGDGTYAPASATTTIGVAKAPLIIAANSATRVAGRPNPAFSASYSGFVNGDDAGDLDSQVQLSSAAAPLSRPGSYPIRATGASDANYAITHQDGTLTVTGDLGFLPLLRR